MFFIVSSFLTISLFYQIYISDEIIIPYGIHPFDICYTNPRLWHYIKTTYIVTFIFSYFIISNFLYTLIIKKFYLFFHTSTKKNNKIITHSLNSNSDLNLLIGLDENTNKNVYIPESRLYQNFLITGTIGSGKTSS